MARSSAEQKVTSPDASEAMYAPYDETGVLTVESASASSDGYITEVTGTVASDFGEDKTSVLVTVVARDAPGTIIGAARDYVDTFPAGGKANFEAPFFSDLPADTRFEAYASV